ncbi:MULTISPECIES: tetratricopeptide repeat protein [unclassified Microcoleus]|uniref:tetratricopeptide repeat protein n=1 Tax=unclassified Microcoleus TaxID=2642155 RepID=UPI0025CCA0D9|nr:MULTISPECIES: tetratricopeptide repeat protein [unclassified Microcoleus]
MFPHPPATQESSPGTQPSPRFDAASVPGNKDEFKKSMKLGYVCYAQRDYQTALINFNRALQVLPDDACAVQAVDNTKMAIVGRRTK